MPEREDSTRRVNLALALAAASAAGLLAFAVFAGPHSPSPPEDTAALVAELDAEPALGDHGDREARVVVRDVTDYTELAPSGPSSFPMPSSDPGSPAALSAAGLVVEGSPLPKGGPEVISLPERACVLCCEALTPEQREVEACWSCCGLDGETVVRLPSSAATPAAGDHGDGEMRVLAFHAGESAIQRTFGPAPADCDEEAAYQRARRDILRRWTIREIEVMARGCDDARRDGWSDGYSACLDVYDPLTAPRCALCCDSDGADVAPRRTR